MRIILVLAALLLINAAHADPAPSQDEVLPQVSDRSFLARMGEMGEKVEEKTSHLVSNAMGFLGVRYRRGGTNSDTGFDCSGFVRAVYEQSIGKILPRRSDEQAAATQEIDRSELKPGDLVFFNTMRRAFSHVGIYVGEGKFIHSPRAGSHVRMEDMRVAYWNNRFNGARRVPMADKGP